MPPATMVTVGWLVTDPTTGYVETNVIGLLTPPTEHADINQPGSNALIRSSDDGKMSLATGGPVGSVQQNLWCLSATATDQKTGLPIPAGQISIGGFGCQDTNAQLWVPLRDNDTNDVTAHVTGVQNYSYTITVNEYPLVYQTRFVALTDPNPARLNLGVGEYVDFQALPDAVWSATGGGLAPNYGGRTFTAASNAPPGGAAASVTARYHGLTKTVNFTVFPPTGYDPASTSIAATSSAYAFLQGEAGAGMHVQVCIAPTSVSFYRVGIKEIAGPGTNGWGYFAQTAWNSPPIPDHSPNRNFVQLDSNNYWGGLADYDDCHFSISPTPPTAGGFTWNIPVVWQIDPNTTNSLCYWGQTNSFDVNGTVTVSKYGLKVTRTINNVWNPNL